MSGRLLDALAEAIPPDVRQPGKSVDGIRCVTVVNHEGLPLHQRICDESPVAAVERIVAVVAEDEVALSRDDQRSPIVTRWMVRGEGGSQRPHDVLALPG